MVVFRVITFSISQFYEDQGMCRLLGFVSREPVIASEVLEGIYESFINVSQRHKDGWGLAWYDENGHLQLSKKPEAAHASEEYAHVVKRIQTDALLSHVRWATPGFSPCLENTHPFTYHLMAFAHNGAVAPNVRLEAWIAPHLQSEIVGMTDSERYFLALISEIEKAPPIEAFRTILRKMHHHLQSSSLNCLLLTPEALYAVCDFDPNALLAQQDPDYFHVQYQVRPDAIVVGSTGLNQDARWEILKNGQMLVVERGTLNMSIIDVTHNTRSSIQEQYKSILQR
jgi:predicted glutamine amidotransferase